jgi:hypothetical protein
MVVVQLIFLEARPDLPPPAVNMFDMLQGFAKIR